MTYTIRVALVPALLLALAACDGSSDPDAGFDAATDDGGGSDSGGTLCAADRDCDDGLYCNGDETCAPGATGADADGCVPGTAPCADASCDEDADTCSCGADSDADSDGHDSMACGGDDCDDDDPNRYPGNEEVCDAEGHDEDCDPTSVGETDVDTDGYVDAACCNGDVCGDDCDDEDVNVNAGAAEMCDGLDNDCSGAPDDASSLCPGGLCLGGRCDFDSWDNVFGTADNDSASGVAIDAAGNVFVAASLGEGTVNFGGGDRTVSGFREGVAVVKYAPDGTYIWDYLNTGVSRASSVRIAVNDTGTRVYLVGYAQGDLGSGSATGGFFMTLDGDGTYLVDHRYGTPQDRLSDVSVNSTGAVVAGKFWQTVDFGGGERSAGSQDATVVLQYDVDGAYVWDRVISASTGGFIVAQSVGVGPSGAIAIGGRYQGTVDLGTTIEEQGAYVALLDATGVAQWGYAVQETSAGSQAVNGVTIASTGQVFAAGDYTGGVDFGTGSTYGSSSGKNGFVVGLSSTGSPQWARSFGGTGGNDSATDLAMSFSGDVLVVGEFTTDTDFGRGIVRPVSTDGFLARYTPDGMPRPDIAFSTTFTRVHGVASGPGDSVVITGLFSDTGNFGSVTRVSAGGTDGFVLRVGS